MGVQFCEVDDCTKWGTVLIRTYAGPNGAEEKTLLCTYHAHITRALFGGQLPVRLPHDPRETVDEALAMRRSG